MFTSVILPKKCFSKSRLALSPGRVDMSGSLEYG